MLKKILLSAILILSANGCSQNETADVKKIDVEHSSESIKVIVGERYDGKTLMDYIKENNKIEEEDGFIVGIDKLIPNQEKKEFIAIYINDEMAMKGANDLILKSGDKIEFKIDTWE